MKRPLIFHLVKSQEPPTIKTKITIVWKYATESIPLDIVLVSE